MPFRVSPDRDHAALEKTVGPKVLSGATAMSLALSRRQLKGESMVNYLNDEQRQQIFDDGYTLIPGAVPPAKVATALRAINSSLGERGIDPEQLITFRAQSYCPEITGSAAILDLLVDTPLWAMAESVIGEGTLKPVNHGQIALRFPISGPAGDIHPHIDGMYTPHNGVEKGKIANFTALVGVYLSDTPTDDAGNFTVWPGTHRLYADYFGQAGPTALLDGMPPISVPEPRQIRPHAGDAVISHYQIGHGIAPNVSGNIRYAVYFRLAREGHDAISLDVMTDLWREWDGMRALAQP